MISNCLSYAANQALPEKYAIEHSVAKPDVDSQRRGASIREGEEGESGGVAE